MKGKPFRWKPHWENEKVDEGLCRASVGRGRAGLSQCGNKPKKGTEWCAAHTTDEVPEEPDMLWNVYIGYGEDRTPKMASVPIVKETKKRIRLAEMHQAFDYKQQIDKRKDDSPRTGFRSKLEAAHGYVEKCEQKLRNAQAALRDAEAQRESAVKLLAKVAVEEDAKK